LRADRRQIRLLPTDLESLLSDDHQARSIWTLVEKLDLSAFENSIKSRGEGAGRPAIDPRILVTLWVFATSEGVGSARELEELCGVHEAYRWICGGVPVCAHTLSDFRVAHPQALEDLLTRLLAVLKNQGLVELKRVAQDGMRVRASAGAASFRREPKFRKSRRPATRPTPACPPRTRKPAS
jgi:transposase